MKKGFVIGLIFLIVIAIIIYYYRDKIWENKSISKRISADGEWKTLSYRLPTTVDPEVFGKYYWKALENMYSEIPCPSCRIKAESHNRFFHDFVNHNLKKPIFDQKNFDEWMDYIVKTKEEIANNK